MKVQDATKELSRRAAKLLGDVGSVRSAAEKTLAELRKIESGFMQREEAEREEKRREEQQKALSSQSKAWTMPDDVPPVEEKKEVVVEQSLCGSVEELNAEEIHVQFLERLCRQFDADEIDAHVKVVYKKKNEKKTSIFDIIMKRNKK